MLLFKKPFWAGLQDGRITLTFRRWQKPHVRTGGRYRCHPIGVLEVDDIRLVGVAEISDDEAKRSGFASRAELVAHLEELGPIDDDTQLYRVALHHGGDGDRVELALEDQLTDEDVEIIRGKLAKMDAKTPWTADTLALIAARPQVVSRVLAATLGRVTLELKTDIRKLKKLGLTQSFEVGYEISPRGRAYLAAVAGAEGSPARTKAATATKPKAAAPAKPKPAAPAKPRVAARTKPKAAATASRRKPSR